MNRSKIHTPRHKNCDNVARAKIVKELSTKWMAVSVDSAFTKCELELVTYVA